MNQIDVLRILSGSGRCDRFLVGTALAAGLIACAAPVLGGTTVSVSAQCNIYGAGHATAPNPGGQGGGLLPVLLNLPHGAAVLTFSDASGTVLYCPACGPANSADGANFGFSMAAYGGIAGFSSESRARFLAGVFVDASEPADPAPTALAVSDYGFARLKAVLRQPFYVGDGRTGTGAGTDQRFFVPASATRLYLGFQDSQGTLPGWYDDNSGSITITVHINSCPADLNSDGQVDDSDFVLFVGAYNILDCADPAMGVGCPADLTGDGIVDDADFIAFVAAYNELLCP